MRFAGVSTGTGPVVLVARKVDPPTIDRPGAAIIEGEIIRLEVSGGITIDSRVKVRIATLEATEDATFMLGVLKAELEVRLVGVSSFEEFAAKLVDGIESWAGITMGYADIEAVVTANEVVANAAIAVIIEHGVKVVGAANYESATTENLAIVVELATKADTFTIDHEFRVVIIAAADRVSDHSSIVRPELSDAISVGEASIHRTDFKFIIDP